MLGNIVIKGNRKWKKMRSGQGSESQGRENITKRSGQKRYMQSISIYPKKVIQKKEKLFAQRMSQ